MQKILVHIDTTDGYGGGTVEDRPIVYSSIEEARLDLEIIFLYHSSALSTFNKEIEECKRSFETNRGRWNSAETKAKYLEIADKEANAQTFSLIKFGGNKFDIAHLGYFCDERMTWIYNAQLTELNKWFDSNFPNLS